MNITTNLLVFLLFLLILIPLLQYFLSTRSSKWPGLVLPILSAMYSLVMLLSIAATGQTAAELLITIVSVLLICNIPTAVFLTIYAAGREKHKRSTQLHKMQVQDLD